MSQNTSSRSSYESPSRDFDILSPRSLRTQDEEQQKQNDILKELAGEDIEFESQSEDNSNSDLGSEEEGNSSNGSGGLIGSASGSSSGGPGTTNWNKAGVVLRSRNATLKLRGHSNQNSRALNLSFSNPDVADSFMKEVQSHLLPILQTAYTNPHHPKVAVSVEKFLEALRTIAFTAKREFTSQTFYIRMFNECIGDIDQLSPKAKSDPTILSAAATAHKGEVLLLSYNLQGKMSDRANSVRVGVLHLLTLLSTVKSRFTFSGFVVELISVLRTLPDVLKHFLTVSSTCNFIKEQIQQQQKSKSLNPSTSTSTSTSFSQNPSNISLSSSTPSAPTTSSSTSQTPVLTPSLSSTFLTPTFSVLNSPSPPTSSSTTGGQSRSVDQPLTPGGILNSLGTVRGSNSNEPNIWDDSNATVEVGTDKKIKYGTLNGLVIRLTSSEHYDDDFRQSFITTYQSLTTPWKLWEKLMQRYHVPDSLSSTTKTTIRLRVCVVIKYWIEHQFFDFDDGLINELFVFIDLLLKDGHDNVAQRLRSDLQKRVDLRNSMKTQMNMMPLNFTIPDTKTTPVELFAAMTEEEISRQLTLIDFNLFSKITASELLNQSWNKKNLKYKSQNVIEMIERLNKLSFWLSTLVLAPEKVSDRIKIMSKLIEIGDKLRAMNNFNSLMGVLACLNMSSVHRLQQTRNALSPALLKTWNLLEELMSYRSSFHLYREALHSCRPPVVPYLGVYLTDLTFIEDGNPDNINGFINFKKRDLISGVVKEIKTYQNTSYTFPVVEPIHTFLLELPSCSESQLYTLSLVREPRTPAS